MSKIIKLEVTGKNFERLKVDILDRRQNVPNAGGEKKDIRNVQADFEGVTNHRVSAR